MKKRALLIVNPTSGKLENQTELVKQICHLATNYAVTVWYTTGNGDEQKIKLLLQENFDLIMVAGGDGTIKLVASQMDGIKIPLLPIPFGSANGLCSCLGIEVWEDSIKALNMGNTIQMDMLDVDGELCLHVCDFGLNAGLIKKFEESDERGMMGYFKGSLSQIFENNKNNFTLEFNGERMHFNAKMLVIANGDRYGTGAKINPTGKLDDGIFEVIVLNPDSFKEWTALTLGFIREDFSTLDFVQTFKMDRVNIENHGHTDFHIDGEMKEPQSTIGISMSDMKIEMYTNFAY
ncbi:NAD(+)/NADH kinase [Aquiflexum sp. TKW24L]|uniref:diacylglycerol/lipid kinase family protein n=1 Tax=Aquiflexum sp. TKW24L TaxID=2942212 RepID=UPI0020BE9F2E|nr:diacylglycerol kinase family protein [Aquiflexum sp. TKW24L]MCL6261043.1 NAD(+)/NADH kinase [Aquiflexum sp. TKW24L]